MNEIIVYILKTMIKYWITIQGMCNVVGKECLIFIRFTKLLTANFSHFATNYVNLSRQYKLTNYHILVSSFYTIKSQLR